MAVTFLDLQRQNKKITNKVLQKTKKIINSSDFILGQDVLKFEKEFALYLHTKYCISVASGTDALLLSLMAIGVGPGDEIIVPAFTFTASVTPIMQLGANPVLVDTLRELPLIDPEKIEQAVTKKTKAIIVVHLYGMLCHMDQINQIAKKYSLAVIEDAAQAHGSLYKHQHAGTIGDIGTFSFYPTKNLGAFGDGGAIVTNNRKIADKLLLFRNHGQTQKNTHILLGTNSRLDSIQAAVLRLKLSDLDRQNKKRRRVARKYRLALTNLPIKMFIEDTETVCNYHIFAVQTKKRDALKLFLEKQGLGTGLYYPYIIYSLPFMVKHSNKQYVFPYAETFSKELLALPMHPEMRTDEIQEVAQRIKKFFKIS